MVKNGSNRCAHCKLLDGGRTNSKNSKHFGSQQNVLLPPSRCRRPLPAKLDYRSQLDPS
jgi:hypothetical protein